MLKVEKLRKVFHDRHGEEIVAVNDLSFECKGNEIIGVLGMNGAGKSTTLRMLSTVISPTSGQITLNGEDMIENAESIRNSIGLLTGTTGLYRKLTARETLYFFADLHGMKKSDTKVKIDELVELLDMHEIIDRKCEKLSTGQKQKVSIARTIIHDPTLLILDEATTGLDVVATQAIVSFIRHVKSPSKAILFCTHRMEEVHQLCDRILILHQGKKLALGTVEEVCQQFDCKDLGEIFSRFDQN